MMTLNDLKWSKHGIFNENNIFLRFEFPIKSLDWWSVQREPQLNEFNKLLILTLLRPQEKKILFLRLQVRSYFPAVRLVNWISRIARKCRSSKTRNWIAYCSTNRKCFDINRPWPWLCCKWNWCSRKWRRRYYHVSQPLSF